MHSPAFHSRLRPTCVRAVVTFGPRGSSQGWFVDQPKMFKNNVTDHKLNVEAIIKNINTISLELKKMKELSQLLLCDLTLHFSHPVKTDDLQEPEEKIPLFEESKISDVSFASKSFSI
ncbi:putative uncharacterized protein C5orf58 homolog isoform X1 [Mustela erminea]|uniref:putative uncharacterized protein C5orf58 homolog isoform X1 n=1 Tax=Mustela erminea TaxID=36723 RepID=UPI0013871F3D|nr:putative uncharacterized protein C5orf58 homolog isoform X1 [Mustela erminea]